MFATSTTSTSSTTPSPTPSSTLPPTHPLHTTLATYYNHHNTLSTTYTDPHHVFLAPHRRSIVVQLYLAVQTYNDQCVAGMPRVRMEEYAVGCSPMDRAHTTSTPSSRSNASSATDSSTTPPPTITLPLRHVDFPPCPSRAYDDIAPSPQILVGSIRDGQRANQPEVCAFAVFPANVSRWCRASSANGSSWQPVLTGLCRVLAEWQNELGVGLSSERLREAQLLCAPWSLARDAKCRALVEAVQRCVVVPGMEKVVQEVHDSLTDSNTHNTANTANTTTTTTTRFGVRERLAWEHPVGEPDHYLPHTLSVILECPTTAAADAVLYRATQCPEASVGTCVRRVTARPVRTSRPHPSPSSVQPPSPPSRPSPPVSGHNLLFQFGTVPGVLNGQAALMHIPEGGGSLEAWTRDTRGVRRMVREYLPDVEGWVDGVNKWLTMDGQ